MWNSISRYHPRIGFTLIPNVRSRIPWETGGYLVRTNSAGFRSEHEFERERTADKFRMILFGDSQTAGDGCSNGQRYSDVVTQLVADLEVFNYGLPATGTDQHYLTYLDCVDVEHDLTVIGMHVDNIGRVSRRFFPFKDEQGHEIIYAKPYFSIEGGQLALHHVPVPKAPLRRAALSADDVEHVDWGVPYVGLRNVVKKLGMRDVMQKITRFQPVPEYNSPDDPHWLLLRKILETWIRACKSPVLLFLIPMWPFVEESSDPTHYQSRFRELANDTGCHLHDPLPDLWKYSQPQRRAFRFQTDSHLTPDGHRAMAASLAPAIERMMVSCRT